MGLKWKYKKAYWKVYRYIEDHTFMHINKKNYYGNKIMSVSDTNNKLIEMVRSGRPFVAARIGGTELRNIVTSQPESKNQKEKSVNYSLLNCLSGFFDPIERIDDFSHLMEESMADVDLMGVWFNQMEDVIINRFCKKDVKLGILAGLEPWYNAENPWTKELAGKKVLVVHPFKDSIMKQYEKRQLLFKDTDILPEFDLKCVKAIQTLMGEHDERISSWFEGLDYMTEECLKEDFDIALIACGAYGMPLAVRLKKTGKQAVHMGGALQLLFGVRGKRWDNFDLISKYYSDAWEYPMKSEHLSKNNNSNVENGCYW